VDAALRFEAVTKRYGDVVAVDASSFTAERGSFVALLGPSGCGKTTTLRLIAGFEQPDAGEIHIDGRPVARVAPHRRPVNTVFQDFSLFPHMTVFDNVAFGPRLKHAPRRDVEHRVGEMLELVRLPGMGARRPHQLSGGQQQRVALARALVNRPIVLLLDEPLSNLDYKLRKEMRLELKRIQREVKITFVFVTHDREEALTMADHVIVMNAGRIQQMGTPFELYTAPANQFMADFIGSANFLHGHILSRESDHTRLQLDRTGDEVLAPASALPDGSPVLLCVRPESIELGPESQPGSPSAVTGVVEEAFYLGHHSELVVRLASGSALHCLQAHRGAAAPRFRPGDRVHLAWHPDESLLFPRQ
jgi:spermidine/putrescine transport system ATP-binding protein